MCDVGALNWEYKKKSEYLSDLDISKTTTSRLEELELERMKFNTFIMAREVAERIDRAVAPKGFMRSIVSKEKQHLFYWDNSYLTYFFQRKSNAAIPGSNYFSKLEAFSKKHIIVDEK